MARAAQRTAERQDPSIVQQVDPETGEVQESTRDLAVRGDSEVVSAVTDDWDYGEDAGQGFENQSSDDVSIPFLVVLQPGSPEVALDPEKPPFPGYILNKTTGDWVRGEEGVTFVPCYTQHLMMEWRPRPPKGEGGVVERHPMDSPIARTVRDTQPLGSYKHPDMLKAGVEPDKCNELVETYYCYGVALTGAGDPVPAVIAFSSTHIKAYQDWMFRVRSIVIPLPNGRKVTAKQLPLWAMAWRIRTRKHPKSTKDQTWYVPEISLAGQNAVDSLVKPRSDLYEFCKSLKEAVASGDRTADESTLSPGPSVDAAPTRAPTDQEDAPY